MWQKKGTGLLVCKKAATGSIRPILGNDEQVSSFIISREERSELIRAFTSSPIGKATCSWKIATMHHSHSVHGTQSAIPSGIYGTQSAIPNVARKTYAVV
jgi:hypothetical protein